MVSAEFVGADVSKRHFETVRQALIGLALMEEKSSFALMMDFGEVGRGVRQRWATRFRATEPLWALAATHGIPGMEDVPQHFHRVRPTHAPEPIRMRSLSTRVKGKRGPGSTLEIPDTEEACALRDEVNGMNAWLAATEIQGCDPVILFRSFTGSLAWGGRWYCEGGGYQRMKSAARVSELRLGGKAICEVDVRASFLTILHGITDTPLPERDPYDIDTGIPRAIVKAWVSQVCGAGAVPVKWSVQASMDVSETGVRLSDFKATAVGRVVLARYPFLARLPALLGCEQEPRLASLRLQRLEANALTFAMDGLRKAGAPCLPMHDALIIAVDQVMLAKLQLKAGYWRTCRVVPVTT